ncbi:glycosyltransferase [Bosea vestrisii]|uniref:glycosyltransferase n=1 Tax=Bosea vestrisii TaxID=151416 RepID=UPI0024E024B1|nr:glycosyltransferase [Bosea vestrisii]WID98750.1 glycosyltransferase [Bosea vestrisii]
MLSVNSRAKRTLRIAVLSYTTIARDYRVLRTLETLAALGHEVIAVGFGEAPDLPVRMIRLPDPPGRAGQRLGIMATQFPANLIPASAPLLHMLLPPHRAAREALLALRPDIVHANDWQALVAADAARQAVGSRIVYDSHELAGEEHADNWVWRLVAQRHTSAIEARFIRRADAVVTVSDGIADTLQALYALPSRPLVIRNAPAYRTVAPAPFTQPLRLLFHGILKSGRGIEAVIGAMPLLPEYRLTLRGDGAPHYLAKLQALAAKLGVASRITFEPAVPHEEVVEAAASSHIGIFCASRDTRHNRFAMPNKIYEYLMAGLAVLVTAETDLADLVETYGCGLTATDSTPDAIAAALRALPIPELNQMRRNALASARALSWDEERQRLISLYETLSAAGQAQHAG